MFVLVDTRKEHFSVDAFDAPGPAELHRYPTKDQVLDNKWIEFSMFQAYLQITCEKYHCSGIFIKYRWTSALLYAYPVKLSQDVSITVNNEFTRICSRDNHWYCVFSIDALSREHVEISLQKVNFQGGPDYLGGLSKPYNCLLAGVTVADGHRTTFMSSDESYIKNLGGIPRDLAVNSILPEITTCHDVPLAVGGRVAWGFPIDTFVSYGSTLLLAIYAYGAYIDLSKSDIKIAARPSYSAGLIVSCPSFPADGILEVGTPHVLRRAVLSHLKPVECPIGNMLYVRLGNSDMSAITGDTVLSTMVSFCTHPQVGLTTVGIYPQLSYQIGSMKVRSFLVQINPYAGGTDTDCYFIVQDFRVSQGLTYDLSVKLPVILGRVRFNVRARNLTSEEMNFGKREKLSGQYFQLHLFTSSMYIGAEINASLPCRKAVRLEQSGETDKIFEHQLQQAADTPDCRNYMIPLWNSDQNNNSNTHLIYLPRIRTMTSFDEIRKSKFKMGKLTALLFNRELGDFLFIVKIHLHWKCGQHCKYITVRIVYRALVSHSIVSLRWNLVLNSSDSQLILSDMPVSGVLLYVMSENDKCLQRGCSANIGITHGSKQNHALSIWTGSASDQTPFAEYHLLWSHGDYTWDEAEEICQELDGMHLASISSEKEYLLITRMLLGSVYRVSDTEKRFLPVLTPCLMGSPLCLIHIGLKRQVS